MAEGWEEGEWKRESLKYIKSSKKGKINKFIIVRGSVEYCSKREKKRLKREIEWMSFNQVEAVSFSFFLWQRYANTFATSYDANKSRLKVRLTITCGKSTFPTCLMTSNIWTIWKRKHQERNWFRHPKRIHKISLSGLKSSRYQFEAGFSGNVHFGYGNFNFSLLVSDKKVLIYGSFLPSCFNFLIALINLLTCFCLFASRFSLSFSFGL